MKFTGVLKTLARATENMLGMLLVVVSVCFASLALFSSPDF